MTLRIALVQFTGSENKQDNIDKYAKYAREAAENGAKIVCTHELFNTIYFPYEWDHKYFELAETIPGPTTDAVAEVAKETGIVMIAPIYEKTMSGEYFNSAAVIGPDGNLIGLYRKMSIPLVQHSSSIGLEKFYFRPGNLGFPTFDTPFGVRIGLQICYDRQFPEGVRALAVNGAEIVFIPITTVGMSRHTFELAMRAHASQNLCYVAGVNRVGKDIGGSPTQHYYGSSLIIDPRGDILVQANDTDEAVIYGDVDLGLVKQLRHDLAYFRDRRPDAYGVLTR